MALKPIEIAAKLFLGPGDLDRSRRALTWIMYGLIQVNREFLEQYPGTPSLYNSPVLYKEERNTEIWQDIPTTLALGSGDCEDLAMWRVAELQRDGIGAMPYISWRPRGRRIIYHALVRHPDGKIEDPSRALGMHGHPVTRAPVYIGIDPPSAYALASQFEVMP